MKEDDAVVYFSQLVEAVAFLHINFVAHLDLKVCVRTLLCVNDDCAMLPPPMLLVFSAVTLLFLVCRCSLRTSCSMQKCARSKVP